MSNTKKRAQLIHGRHGSGFRTAALALGLATLLGSTPLLAQQGQPQQPPPGAQVENTEEGQMITLNLKDADISALISTVSEVTGRNFIVDPRVNAKVTVISQGPMPADELYRVFLSVLQVHGFSAVPSGAVTKIIPDINAKQVGISDVSDDYAAGDAMVTRVIKVVNVPVAQLVPILRPLVPQQGHLAAYPPTNVLIISDRAGNIDRMQSLINEIDRASDDEIEVIRLEHASAAEVVRILSTLQQADPNQAGGEMRLAADERTNSVLLSGDMPARLRLRALIANLDLPVEGTGDTKVIYLRYAKATDLVTVLTGVSEQMARAEQGATGGANGQSQAGRTALSDDISIQAEEASNALVITAPPAVQRSLESVIRQLDVRRAQVLIEAAIAEIQSGKDRELGVDVGVIDSEGERPAAVSLMGALTPQWLQLFAAENAEDIATAVASGGIPTGFNIALGDTNGRYRYGALLRALATDTRSNILSTPSIVTLDNEEAEIRVAQNVPFVTGNYIDDAGGATNPFQTVEREDVGLILKVKPQINEGNDILLEIEQEVSNLLPGSQQTGFFTTNKRSIKSTVMVEDGQLLALGGLIDEEVTETETKVPLLGDIPLIGRLFSSQTAGTSKRNLVLFMQPSILRDAALTDNYSGRKYNFFRAEQLQQRERGVSLLGNEQPPLLPQREIPELPVPFDNGL